VTSETKRAIASPRKEGVMSGIDVAVAIACVNTWLHFLGGKQKKAGCKPLERNVKMQFDLIVHHHRRRYGREKGRAEANERSRRQKKNTGMEAAAAARPAEERSRLDLGSTLYAHDPIFALSGISGKQCKTKRNGRENEASRCTVQY
jgi:hypothetical protein